MDAQQFSELREANDRHVVALQNLIFQLKRHHPENCTPALYAEMRNEFIANLQRFSETLVRFNLLSKLTQKHMELNGTCTSQEWMQELMEELSEVLGSEFENS